MQFFMLFWFDNPTIHRFECRNLVWGSKLNRFFHICLWALLKKLYHFNADQNSFGVFFYFRSFIKKRNYMWQLENLIDVILSHFYLQHQLIAKKHILQQIFSNTHCIYFNVILFYYTKCTCMLISAGRKMNVCLNKIG